MTKLECNLCQTEIKTTFLDKIKGTIITKEGKKLYVCPKCQSKHKEKLKEKLSS